jgi:histidyl-tRNA synthetase
VLNSVGCATCRPAFQQALVDALGADLARLCADCQRRAATNPLRIYDCKVAADQPIIDRLPRSIDYLCEPCRTHFDGVQTRLTAWGIPWRLSHRLVRGLDYYTRTTFEVLGESLGAQNALLGGGRYDGLVQVLGGPDRPGIGFAAGLERLVLALPAAAAIPARRRVFVAAIGEPGRDEALRLLRDLRQAGLSASMEFEARGVRAQMKRADRSGARVTLIVGGDELARGEVTLRDMQSGAQRAVARSAAVAEARAACDMP